ncbi:MAG: polyprenyl synthetase family protein [Bradymonadaceae bacterium]
MMAMTQVESDFLERFELVLKDVLASPTYTDREPRVLMEAARYLSLSPGAKRMRPQLVNHFGAAVDAPLQARLDVAVAAELMHAASLMHDDVVDEGKERRGKPTVNAQWSNSVAVLSGDLMLCLALTRLSAFDHSISLDAVELVAQMTWAAMHEVECRGDVYLSVQRWRAIAEGKTGALLAWCGTAPARVAGHEEESWRFARCGHHLGVAFQLADDLKDFLDRTTGKDPLADLRNRNPAYPIALALERSDAFRDALGALWEREVMIDDEIEAMGHWMVELDVHLDTMAACEREIAMALDALGPYQNLPGGVEITQWGLMLEQMARQCLENRI